MYAETAPVDGSSYIETSEQKKYAKMKYCSKRITTCDNCYVQFHDQEESKWNSNINVNKAAHTPTHDQMINRFI